MNNNNKNFAEKFVPKTKEQIREENEKKEFLERYERLKEQNKKTTVLGEEIKKAAEKITKSSFYQKPPQQIIDVKHELNEQIETKIKLDDPLVYKNGKITIDSDKLSEIISKQNKEISNKTIDQFLRSHGYDNIYGGGAVGIKTEDIDGNQTFLLKSVSDIIFKGDGVTVNRQGKNIEINIPGASVVAGDPTIDFARESSVIEMYTQLSTMYTLLQQIAGISFVTAYPDGIGGNSGNTYWLPY
jgi:hypothetical protein